MYVYVELGEGGINRGEYFSPRACSSCVDPLDV